jgi:hypothetical protein
MLLRPEGLWPEATRQRELHEVENAVRASKLEEESAEPRS